MKLSTAELSVGMLGTCWNDGSKNADAGGPLGVDCETISGSLPGLATGIERSVEDGCVYLSLSVGDAVEVVKELLVIMTL